jgi:DNA helicase-4
MPEAQARYPGILRSVPPDALNALQQNIDGLNEAFRAVEIERPLFETLESSPLTEEQRAAAVCFDNRLMLVAAAGSGKTATMVAKAAYAIEAGIVKPCEILMLAFNRAAAEELRSRMDKRLGHIQGNEEIVSWTFHKFGLDVIGKSTGKKLRPAPWLDNGQDVEKVASIIKSLSASDPVFYLKLMLLKMVFAKPLAKFGANEVGVDEDADTGKRGFRTLKGDVVKSGEELLIADWLYFNGVNYLYEPSYQFETATDSKTQYHPDFYYPDIDLYHEHFALDSKGRPPSHFKDYAEGVEWKRRLHAEKGTQLVETTSHTLRQGQGLKTLELALTSRGVELKPDPNRVPAGRPVMESEVLASILRSLMQHAKSNQLSLVELESRALKLDAVRGPLFVSIYGSVIREWDSELKAINSVDYDDMINLAIEHAESGAYRSPYRLVIADEYQDSSFSRARLLRAVTGRPDAFLCVVGDDWQSINRFAGADIGVMRSFNEYFGGGTTLFLSRTFRCPPQICEVSSAFVQANPSQIAKAVKTTSSVQGKSIQCFAASQRGGILELVERDLLRISARLASDWAEKRRPCVMILGRYKKDKPANWQALQQICAGQIELSFTTVHSSKGAEADYVLIVNVTQGRNGFPSEIEDDPILQVATPEPEDFPFAEERRLFYVALTRARKGVFIYTIADRPSAFLVELKRSGALTITGPDGSDLQFSACPQCSVGFKTIKTGKFNQFAACSRFPKCNWTAKNTH